MARSAREATPVASMTASKPETREKRVSLCSQSRGLRRLPTVGVVLEELVPLLVGVVLVAVQVNVDVGSVNLTGNVHLHTGVSGKGELGSTVEAQKLGKEQTSGAGTDDEDVRADAELEHISTVNGTGCGLDEAGLDVGQVLDGVELARVPLGVLGETAVPVNRNASTECLICRGLTGEYTYAVTPFASKFWQKRGLPSVQEWQPPQPELVSQTTRWPTSTFLTFLPS